MERDRKGLREGERESVREVTFSAKYVGEQCLRLCRFGRRGAALAA